MPLRHETAHAWAVPTSGVYSIEGALYPLKIVTARPDTSGTTLLVAGVAGKKLRVVSYRLQATGTVTVKFRDSDGVGLSQFWDFQAREGCAIAGPPPLYEFESDPGKGLALDLSASVPVNVTAQYIEVE